MRAWTIQAESAAGTRPHRLDERVLTIVAEAVEADPAAFDADIVGDSDRIRATFDVLADDAVQAAASATAIFARALRAASPGAMTSDDALVDRLQVTDAGTSPTRG